MSAANSQLWLPDGFRFASCTAGIKASGRPDLALIEAPHGASGAAVFTRNRVVAAPVEVGRAHLAKTGGHIRAVLVNAGNANCATGKAGIKAAEAVCAATAARLEVAPEFIFPSSTGIIGVPLPAEKIYAALPSLVGARGEGEQALRSLAEAIMTTDTRPKIASAKFGSAKKHGSVTAVAKGSGMIHPNMATMLVYILTDVAASPAELGRSLKAAVDLSFNAISVDGDTSTNDTVLLLASGKSGLRLKDAGVRKGFESALLAVCKSLAEQIVRDGEGAQHLVRLHIEQASTLEEARRVARSIANSPLVKTAWAGADPNWGRMLSSVGMSGVDLDPAKVSIYIGKQQVCKGGMACEFDANAAHAYLKQPEYVLRVRLGRGKSSLEFLTCDLTTEYIHINADYST
jgi:glutamate N-acetyltransferase / amino-acid N-acetyltransferase